MFLILLCEFFVYIFFIFYSFKNAFNRCPVVVFWFFFFFFTVFVGICELFKPSYLGNFLTSFHLNLVFIVFISIFLCFLSADIFITLKLDVYSLAPYMWFSTTLFSSLCLFTLNSEEKKKKPLNSVPCSLCLIMD